MAELLQRLNKYKDEIFLGGGIVVFALTLLPLFAASFYNHMYYDDFLYAARTREIVLSDASFFKQIFLLLQGALSSSWENWQNWSGCYTSYFFSALAPYIWGDEYVFLNTFILLGAFIMANCISFRWIAIDLLQLPVKQAWVIFLSALFISVQFIPSTAEAYYWFNGSFYHIVGYSMGLLLFAILLKALFCDRKMRYKRYGVLACILAVLFAGTNYTMMLLYMVIYACALPFLFIRRKRMEKERFWFVLVNILVFYAGGLVSILAPGNGKRQTVLGESQPALAAILKALLSVGEFIRENTNVLMFVILLLTVPFIFVCAKQMKYAFYYPVFITLLSYIALAITFTPTLYTMDSLWPARTYNMYFFTYIVLLYINVFYWCGWISRRKYLEAWNAHRWLSPVNYGQYAILTAILLFILVPVETVKDMGRDMAFGKAFISFRTGELQEYDRQIEERYALYNNPEIMDVVVPRLSVNPTIVSVQENESLSEDPGNGVNQAVAEYFGKESVTSR